MVEWVNLAPTRPYRVGRDAESFRVSESGTFGGCHVFPFYRRSHPFALLSRSGCSRSGCSRSGCPSQLASLHRSRSLPWSRGCYRDNLRRIRIGSDQGTFRESWGAVAIRRWWPIPLSGCACIHPNRPNSPRRSRLPIPCALRAPRELSTRHRRRVTVNRVGMRPPPNPTE